MKGHSALPYPIRNKENGRSYPATPTITDRVKTQKTLVVRL
jgi:hypothetical protein